jgi:hypothetical protein
MSDDGTTEAIASAGLFLIFTAVIALVVGLASWGASDLVLASVAGAIAVSSFAGSIVCFRTQADERERQPVTAR